VQKENLGLAFVGSISLVRFFWTSKRNEQMPNDYAKPKYYYQSQSANQHNTIRQKASK